MAELNQKERKARRVENTLLRRVARSDMEGDRAQRAAFNILGQLNLRAFARDAESEIERLAILLEDETVNRFDIFTRLGINFSKELMKAENGS